MYKSSVQVTAAKSVGKSIADNCCRSIYQCHRWYFQQKVLVSAESIGTDRGDNICKYTCR